MTLPQIRESTTLLEFFRQLVTGAPIVNGKHVTCVCKAAGGVGQTFPHGLGRLPQGNVVVSNSNPAAAFAVCGQPHPELIGIQLSAAVDVTVKVWVY